MSVGLTKRWLEEREERGYASSDDLAVCPRHVTDPFLQQTLESSTQAGLWCSYCPDRDVDAAPLDTLSDAVAHALHRFYETAANACVPWEGGWVWPVLDTYDVIDELCGDGGIDDEVAEHLRELFDEEDWVPAFDPWDSPDTSLRAAWAQFCDYVKHQSRFMFKGLSRTTTPHDGPDDSPQGMLGRLSEVLLGQDLVNTLPARTALYRARAAETPRFDSVHDFTSPPADLAAQGRMNPAGISLFYGALEPETAAVEVYNGLPRAAVATFYALRDLTIVDLRQIPEPSQFDTEMSEQDFYAASFLRGFIADVSKPIVRDDRVHREYVPTQVFTEYLRYQFHKDVALDGILVGSSMRPHGTNVILFADQAACLDKPQLDGLERTGEQLLRCDTAMYQVFEFTPPGVGTSTPNLFDPDAPTVSP
jgi:hypothetical protein